MFNPFSFTGAKTNRKSILYVMSLKMYTGFTGALFCSDYIIMSWEFTNDLPVSFWIASMALEQWSDWPRASAVTLNDEGKMDQYHTTII